MSSSKNTFIESSLTRIHTIKNETMQRFYYLESEALRYKPNEKTWSAVECIEHINLVNHSYLKQLTKYLANADTASDEEVKSAWLGKMFAAKMAPVTEKKASKMKTFARINPIERAKKGYAVVEKVVFQNFMNDMQQLENALSQAEEKKVNGVRFKSTLPFLTFTFKDVIEMLLNHTERHLIQAENTAKHN